MEGREFEAFVDVIARLRAPDGCPWDRAQTHRSIAKNMVEEAYEAVHAIENDDIAGLREELGDVLLQVVLQSQIAADAGEFTVDDVISDVNGKIIRRHPHVFGEATAATPAEVHKRWDEIKRVEKSEKGKGLLDEIPSAMPALMLAQTISRKAVAAGFEWDSLEGVWAKVHEEIDELKAVEPGSAEAQDELGDLLFTIVNLARKQGIDAETALRSTCDKFRGRWASMEQGAAAQGRDIADMTLEEQEGLWQQAKERENNS